MDLIERAAQFLADANRAGVRGPRMPEETRPPDLETALAVQRRVTALLGRPVGGWKASLPKPDKIMMAPIFAEDIHKGERCPIVPVSGMAAIEPEIAYVLRSDLQPGASEDAIRAAIGETRLVLELIGSRFEEPDALSFPEKLADRLNHQGLLLGPVLPQGTAEWAAGFPIRIPGVFEGQGKHPDGHPFAPLKWLAGQTPLRAGQVITTGSYAGVIRVPMDQPLRVQFGDAGEIAVTFYAPDRS